MKAQTGASAAKGVLKMPLSIAPPGMAVEVKNISADDKVKKHLAELGIAAGSRITVISSNGGNVILMVKEGRLCLDKTLASHIMVIAVHDNMVRAAH